MKKEDIKQFFIYLGVGALATIVEWVFFYLFNSVLGIHYSFATTIAFIFSTFANWLFGRLLLFKKSDNKSVWTELVQIYAASIVGLLMNLLLMYIAVDLIGIGEMMSKVCATGIVFFWNFLIRKLYIYKK